MADKPKTDPTEEVTDLFTRATTDIDALSGVSKYIRTGRRWDIRHSDVIGELLVLRSYKDITTRYGERCLVKVDHEGMEKDCLMGTETLSNQIRELGVNLPVLATIRKPGKAFVLLDPTKDQIEAYKAKYLK